MCDVNVTGAGSTAWRINGSLQSYSLNNLFFGSMAGYNVSGRNIVIEDIMMDDVRNGSLYQCVINVDFNPNPIKMGYSTILYVAGEFNNL